MMAMNGASRMNGKGDEDYMEVDGLEQDSSENNLAEDLDISSDSEDEGAAVTSTSNGGKLGNGTMNGTVSPEESSDIEAIPEDPSAHHNYCHYYMWNGPHRNSLLSEQDVEQHLTQYFNRSHKAKKDSGQIKNLVENGVIRSYLQQQREIYQNFQPQILKLCICRDRQDHWKKSKKPKPSNATLSPLEEGAPTSPLEAGAPTSPLDAGAPTSPLEAGAPTSPLHAGAPTSPLEAGAPTSPLPEAGAPPSPLPEAGAPTSPLPEEGATKSPLPEADAPTSPLPDAGAPTSPLSEADAPTSPLQDAGAPSSPSPEAGASKLPKVSKSFISTGLVLSEEDELDYNYDEIEEDEL